MNPVVTLGTWTLLATAMTLAFGWARSQSGLDDLTKVVASFAGYVSFVATVVLAIAWLFVYLGESLSRTTSQ